MLLGVVVVVDRVICQILVEDLEEMVVAVMVKTTAILRNRQWLDQQI